MCQTAGFQGFAENRPALLKLSDLWPMYVLGGRQEHRGHDSADAIFVGPQSQNLLRRYPC